VAYESGQWYIDLLSKYATGRFALDLLPHIQPQVMKYCPFKPLTLPTLLKRAHPITINPNIAHLALNSEYQWRSKKSHEVVTVALLYSWKNNFKYCVEPGEKQKGIAIATDGMISIIPAEIPWMCRSIFFITIPKKLTEDFEIFDDLESVTLSWLVCSEILSKRFRAQKKPEPSSGLGTSRNSKFVPTVTTTTTTTTRDKLPTTTSKFKGVGNVISPRVGGSGKEKESKVQEKEALLKKIEEKKQTAEIEDLDRQATVKITKKKSKVITLDESYELAKFLGRREEIGVACSIIQGKFYRRAINAPWEYSAICVGANNNNLADIILNEDLKPFLPLYWRLTPRNLRLGVLSASGYPPNYTAFIEVAPSTNSGFPTNTTKVVTSEKDGTLNFGDSYVYVNMRTIKKNVNTQVTLYHSIGVGANEWMGEVSLNLRKFYQESVQNGGRVIHKDFELSAGKKEKKIILLKLRFVAQ